MLRLQKGVWRDDRGASLLIALAFLSLFSLSIAALLSFSATSVDTSTLLKVQRNGVYGADGAVQALINSFRSDPTKGSVAGSDSSLTLNGVNPTVSWNGSLASYASNTVTNTPTDAITTLSTAPPSVEDGLYVGSNNWMAVYGGVKVHSDINVSNPNTTMTVTQGNVVANACLNNGSTPQGFGQGLVQVTPTAETIQCGPTTTVVTDPGVTDTHYAPLIASPPTPGSWSGCVFQPGSYTNAANLSNAVNACAPVAQFRPGIYYFNFTDSPPVFSITNAGTTVIGGTAAPGGLTCKGTLGDGVQWLFDGASRLSIIAGALELCANPTPNTQQIAVYGLKASTATQVTTLSPTTVTSPTGPFNNPSNAGVPDGSYATATLNAGGTASASLRLTGYGNTIPAGSTISSAILHVKRLEGGADPTRIASAVTVTPAGGTSTAQALTPSTVCTTVCDSTADVTSLLAGSTNITGTAVSYTGSISGVSGSGSTVSLNATTAASSGGGFNNPTRAEAVDGSGATATVSSGGSSVLSLAGYGSVPAGSTITSAVLHVVHRESGSTGQLGYVVTTTSGSSNTINLNGGAACSTYCDVPLTLSPLPTTLSGFGASLTASMSSSPGGRSSSADIDAMYLVVTYAPPAAGIDAVDGVQLVVTYTVPGFVGEGGCLTVPGVPFGTATGATPVNSSSCALVHTEGANTTVDITGTVYAPLASLDIALAHNSSQIFGRGVVCRALFLQLPSSSPPNVPHIFVPPIMPGSSTPLPRVVHFVAMWQGVVLLRADVNFNDNDPTKPLVQVVAWSVPR